MDEEDLEHYLYRAQTERLRARDASRADVAAIHIELADQYEALVEHSRLREMAQDQPMVRWAH